MTRGCSSSPISAIRAPASSRSSRTWRSSTRSINSPPTPAAASSPAHADRAPASSSGRRCFRAPRVANDHADEAERIIRIVLAWAMAQPTIRAVALVGSHARQTASQGSDIDFVMLALDPDRFRSDETWQAAIDWSGIGARLANWRDEDYGALWSRRMWLEDDRGEIEVGFAGPAW